MDHQLRSTLIALAKRDSETRERLAAEGSLYEGYHPEMEAVHHANAVELNAMLSRSGWPTSDEVGDEGAEAAWLIAQHAISLPEFQKRCLDALQEAAAQGTIPLWQPAMLLDRIRAFEGRPQLYGTSFDWDERGMMSPVPIEDPDSVDQRRAAVGLSPLQEAIRQQRELTRNEPRPVDLMARRRQMVEWAERVGWR